MGISVVLEDEVGAPLETLEDPTNILHKILPASGDTSFRCLAFIDWYGNTVFNRLQADTFLSEWSAIERNIGAEDTRSKELAAGVRRLAERLQETPHVYLKFYGD